MPGRVLIIEQKFIAAVHSKESFDADSEMKYHQTFGKTDSKKSTHNREDKAHLSEE